MTHGVSSRVKSYTIERLSENDMHLKICSLIEQCFAIIDKNIAEKRGWSEIQSGASKTDDVSIISTVSPELAVCLIQVLCLDKHLGYLDGVICMQSSASTSEQMRRQHIQDLSRICYSTTHQCCPSCSPTGTQVVQYLRTLQSVILAFTRQVQQY